MIKIYALVHGNKSPMKDNSISVIVDELSFRYIRSLRIFSSFHLFRWELIILLLLQFSLLIVMDSGYLVWLTIIFHFPAEMSLHNVYGQNITSKLLTVHSIRSLYFCAQSNIVPFILYDLKEIDRLEHTKSKRQWLTQNGMLN